MCTTTAFGETASFGETLWMHTERYSEKYALSHVVPITLLERYGAAALVGSSGPWVSYGPPLAVLY